MRSAEMLEQWRDVIYYTTQALEDVAKSREASEFQRVYRGLQGVRLPDSVYKQENIINWPAFSSSSLDQSVAAGFAAGAGAAAVFILTARSCCDISDCSRFQREVEQLFMPNTRFQVTRALTSEMSEVLGKSQLQLFEVEERNDEEVACVSRNPFFPAPRETSVCRKADEGNIRWSGFPGPV